MSFPTLLFGRWLTVHSYITLFIFRTLHQPSAAKNAGCELLEASPLLIQFRERFCLPREQQCSCVCRVSKPSFALVQTPPVALDLGLGRVMQGKSLQQLALLRRLQLDLGNSERQSNKETEKRKARGKEGRGKGRKGRRGGKRGEKEREREHGRIYISICTI